MGIMATNESERNTRLNQRITSDLRSRVQSSERDDPDLVDDSSYVDNTKKTGRFGWVWAVLIILAIVSLICIAFI